MFLSNRDIKWAIQCKELIVEPSPGEVGYDHTSIDLHLDSIEEATIWDVASFDTSQRQAGGHGPELGLGTFNYAEFSRQYLISPPAESSDPATAADQIVCRRGSRVIVKPGGFLLWTTREVVGTPEANPRLIAFINAKSTRARAGLMVHLTAPTINSGWQGKIILEIANLGPFHLVLQEGDVVAQLTVATISSPPDLSLLRVPSQTHGQMHATGQATPQRQPGQRRRRGN